MRKIEKEKTYLKNTLSERQKEVLRLACFDKKEIGKRLYISEQTVNTHFNTINLIYGTHNKASALIEALKRGELALDEIIEE